MEVCGLFVRPRRLVVAIGSSAVRGGRAAVSILGALCGEAHVILGHALSAFQGRAAVVQFYRAIRRASAGFFAHPMTLRRVPLL